VTRIEAFAAERSAEPRNAPSDSAFAFHSRFVQPVTHPLNDFLQRSLIRVFPVLALSLAAWFWFSSRPIPHPPGILIPKAPEQGSTAPESLPDKNGWRLQKLATYHIQGRVLSVKKYYAMNGDLAPVDVALGWGAMSDSAVLDQLEISQSNRFYFYEWKNAPPIPATEIICSSSNNHIIPANGDVAAFVSHLKRGHLVDFEGFLVSATRDGITWRSSLTRTDTGNGACELIYLTSARFLDAD